MQVSLRNFRCHETFDVDFAPNSLTLLQGDTGAGKSTVLQAVAWALFGRRFVSNVDPAAKKNARTSVKITTPTHVVYRQKSPGLLRVTVLDQDSGSTVLENESAQAEISRAFGSEEVWLASSYIMQDTRGSFLELSWSGTEPITLADGSQRTFLEDGDTVTLRAVAPGPHGALIGLGECTGTVLAAR